MSITFGFFIKQLAARMQEDGLDLPFRDDEVWHSLLYDLKKRTPEAPAFLKNLQFDWDGPYPKSPDLSSFLQGLHRIGSVSALNPSYERIQIPEAVLRGWKAEGSQIDAGTSALLDEGLKFAKKRVLAHA